MEGYFVRSGWLNDRRSLITTSGNNGNYWSMNATEFTDLTDSTNGAKSHGLGIGNVGSYPNGGPYSRIYGFPLRCLAL